MGVSGRMPERGMSEGRAKDLPISAFQNPVKYLHLWLFMVTELIGNNKKAHAARAMKLN
jgi:hypothetical protein